MKLTTICHFGEWLQLLTEREYDVHVRWYTSFVKYTKYRILITTCRRKGISLQRQSRDAHTYPDPLSSLIRRDMSTFVSESSARIRTPIYLLSEVSTVTTSCYMLMHIPNTLEYSC